MSLPSTPRDPDAIARLRADFAAQQAQLAAQGAQIAAQEAQIAALQAGQRRPAAARPRRPMRRLLPLALAALLVALVPLATLAANPFTDLVPGSVHNANIDALYNAGITTGCVPNAQYCPTDLVTRQEMASFLARAAGLGTNPPVANAKTAQTAALATNANTVGGFAPNGLVRAATAPDPSDITLNTSTYTRIRSLTITAPGPGFVLVTGTIDSYGNGAGCPCTVRSRLNDVTAFPTTGLGVATVPGGAGTNFATSAETRVFAVSAGPHTFAIESLLMSGTSTVSAFGSLTALFVPFGSTGAATLDLQPTAPVSGPQGGQP